MEKPTKKQYFGKNYRIAHPFSLVFVYECNFDDVLLKFLLSRFLKDLHHKKATEISFHLGYVSFKNI